MKLYTEEQVKDAFIRVVLKGMSGSTLSTYELFEMYISELTPIELPSDVDIGKIVLGNSPIMEHRDSGYFALGAMEYNKWLKEQILNQNK